jgi:twitching motility protein PilU
MNSDQAGAVVNEMLRVMVERHASDLFLTAGFPPAVKLDGQLHALGQHPLDAAQTRTLAEAIMSPRQCADFDATHESNFALAVTGVGRFRVNVFQQQGCTGIVMRAIQERVPSLAELAMPAVIGDIALARSGIVLVVGATGAGKSTSCAAMVDHRNRNANDHIITIEDPIEFVHVHRKSIITQREIGSDTESWGVALRNAMRQAPDVIVMGELRDREAVEHAISFAETGHLCIATMHSTNAYQAIDRIVNLFGEDRRGQVFMHLSFNLRAVISQRLVPRRSGVGRVAAVEVLINTPLMSDLIFKGDLPHLREQMRKMREYGMQSFDQHLFELHEAGLIAYDDALRNADSVNDLRINIKLNSRQSMVRGRGADALTGSTDLGLQR